MKKEEIQNALQIRYVDLKFTLSFPKDSTLPENKVSALRGGMGQMLLQQNCIRDRKCEFCDFSMECLIRRMMYSKYEIQPRFAGQGDSIGYVIECDNHKKYLKAGERLVFHLLLYGKTIVYFGHFLQAFYMLGQYGLGQHHETYQIIKVQNEKGQLVVDKSSVYLHRLGIRTVEEYVKERELQIANKSGSHTVCFQTPATIKYQEDFLKEFHSEAIFRSVLRRIYSFDCFEGIEMPLLELDEELPQIVHQEAHVVKVPRYSSTMQARMNLIGILGQVEFDGLSENLLTVLLACEKLHIGKNTSFGFGKYFVK